MSFQAQARIDFKRGSEYFPTAGISFIIKIAWNCAIPWDDNNLN